MKLKVTDEHFIKTCNEAISMAEACAELGMHFNTFKRHAVRLKCYEPNQGLKNGTRYKTPVFTLEDILAGKHPHYQTLKLKKRLLREGVKENKCDICGQDENWNGKMLVMELDHVDGNRFNHMLDNLRMICPNCHSQTETYRGKNAKK